jgi:hypothetical protein
MTYRLWTNAERTLMVRLWSDGMVEMAERDSPKDIWPAMTPLPGLPNWIDNLTEERTR